MATKQSDVLVIGGGLAGIVTALECLRAGQRVILVDRDTTNRRVVTAWVSDVQAGEWIEITNEQIGTQMRITTNRSTVFERPASGVPVIPADIAPGAHLTVWYRSVGERRPVADKVRLLEAR